jgi:hypothetical protein
MLSPRWLCFTLSAGFIALCLFSPMPVMDDTNTPIPTPQVGVTPTGPVVNSSVSWAAVFGGAIVALAFQMLFTTLGAGIGAAAIDPYDRDNPVKGVPTGALVWWLVTGLISLFVGGWVAGKLSGATSFSDASIAVGGMHGLVMWSLATVLTFLLLLTSAGKLIGGMMRVVFEGISLVAKGAAATVPVVGNLAASAAKEVIPAFDWEKIKREVRNLLRETGRPELQPENVEKKADQVKQKALDFIKDPLAGDEELSSMLKQVYGEVRDAFNAGDRETLVNMLSARTGKAKDEINKVVDRIENVYQDVKKEYKATLATMEQKARETADATASVISRATIWTFAALICGMVISTAGAVLGVSRPNLFLFW